MTKTRDHPVIQWDRPIVYLTILTIGLILIVVMSQKGGLGANFPYNLLGFVGFCLTTLVFITGGIANVTRDASLRLPRMISAAKESIYIFSGQLAKNAYIGSSEVTPIELLFEKAKSGVRVNIITEWDPDPETLEAIKKESKKLTNEALQNNFTFLKLKDGAISCPGEHFMMVDKKNVRIEEEHNKEATDKRLNREVRFSLYLHSLLEKKFAALSEKAEKINLN